MNENLGPPMISIDFEMFKCIHDAWRQSWFYGKRCELCYSDGIWCVIASNSCVTLFWGGGLYHEADSTV